MITYCRMCMNPSTRPRIIFKNGICNACIYWFEIAPKINWKEKYNQLGVICESMKTVARANNNSHDVVVGVSGGKDGSYVAHKLREDFGMNPLCVTFSPPMQTEIGRQNLENFRNKGDFDLIEIRPKPSIYKRLCKKMFIDQARCKFPFVIGIFTAVAQTALRHNIPFICGGEQGEQIYGGNPKHDDMDFMTPEFAVDVYHEGNDLTDYIDSGFTENELKWWIMPEKYHLENLMFTWWSKWEMWDDRLHRDLAVLKCGLQSGGTQTGTFTSFSQTDCKLQDLHQFEKFIRFGYGRASDDCNLAIHAGRMTRKEAVEIVREKDGEFPVEYIDNYIKFFNMSKKEFWEILDGHVNYDILEKSTEDFNKPWVLKKGVR